MTTYKEAQVLDVSGELCPMPVVKTRLALDKLTHGQIIKVIATDVASCDDMPAFARAQGHKLLEARSEKGTYTYWLQKGEGV